MQTVDLNVDYSDLMTEEERRAQDGKMPAFMLGKIKEIVENSILSSLEDVLMGGKRFIRGVTQRKVDRILDQIEDSEDGKLTMPDKRMAVFRDMWSNRLAGPAGGANRKLMQRIDRRICPDAYLNEDGDEAAPEGETK